MRFDGYVCEVCLRFAPRNYGVTTGALPAGWVEHSRYTGPGSPRNLHWCSMECRDQTVEIKKSAELKIAFLSSIQEACE